jgi:hypothetical protein
MNDSFAVDPSFAGYLRSALQKSSERAGYPISLENLLERWKRFVSEVEQGYGDSIYEYANDLAVRNLLKNIETDAPANLRASLAAYLAPLDRRFFDATRPVRRTIPGLAQQSDAPWSVRIPKKADGELLDDLRSHRLIS